MWSTFDSQFTFFQTAEAVTGGNSPEEAAGGRRTQMIEHHREMHIGCFLRMQLVWHDWEQMECVGCSAAGLSSARV